jgi:hypothetical protein
MSDHDCCQYCCQATGQRRSRVDGCGISAQHTDCNGGSWTTCLAYGSQGYARYVRWDGRSGTVRVTRGQTGKPADLYRST